MTLFNSRTDLGKFNGLDLDKIYHALPEYPKGLLRHHLPLQELVLAMFSILVTLPALIPNVYIEYGGKRIYPFLFLMVILPPAGGKGVIGLSRLLLADINLKLSKEFDEVNRRYEHEMLVFKKNAGKPGSPTLPTPPKMPQVIIPGNTSAARFIVQLSENGDRIGGIINETEADALSNLLGTELGGQSSIILRQAYHHEPISSARKGNRETLVAHHPKLGILVAGTENQLQALFKQGSQDGLTSRFAFVEPEGNMEWVTPRPLGTDKPIEEQYRQYGRKSLELWPQTKDLDLEVQLTPAQWDELDRVGEEMQRQAHLEGGVYAVSIARRHALMLVRFCTILSFFRHIDPETCKVPSFKGPIFPTEEDFWVSKELTKYSFQKALDIFKRMPGPPSIRMNHTRQFTFYTSLPQEFTMPEAIEVAAKENIPPRTKDRWLKEFVETGALERLARGHYRKCHVAEAALAEEYSPIN
ncbi:DUF3987 domain-containing protein [Rufibacter radiotolerans]|nr:DUF3987 domain-containing protein [Rufibacter radiotolerans]